MRLHVPIGIDDFRMLRERRLEYIDKSHLISELIDNPGLLVLLFPRPPQLWQGFKLDDAALLLRKTRLEGVRQGVTRVS